VLRRYQKVEAFSHYLFTAVTGLFEPFFVDVAEISVGVERKHHYGRELVDILEAFFAELEFPVQFFLDLVGYVMPFGGVADGADQEFVVDLSFYQIILRPRFDGVYPDKFVVDTRQHDYRNFFCVCAKPGERFQSGFVRKRKVEQDHVEFFLFNQRYG